MHRAIISVFAFKCTLAFTGCADLCVDDGLQSMQRDKSCRSMSTTEPTETTGGTESTTVGSTEPTTNPTTGDTDPTTGEPTTETDTTTDTGGSMCGNGVVDDGEECDDGNSDNSDFCLDNCLTASCGDGFVGPGEVCDDGNLDNTDGCLDSCVPAICGDGFVGPGEECDDANNINTDTCLDTCAAASCGDGFVGPGEGCDDGNDNNDDECTNACALASCGDGVVQMGEVCDDGNADNADACLDTCVLATCGDSFVHNGVEECDDGNVDNTDQCLDNCVLATCGDSFVQAGVEECDDGNEDSSDMCTVECLLPMCGDGFVQPLEGEECDDGNFVDGDGCEASCLFTPGAKQVALGDYHSCALIHAGDVRCWGNNDFGNLGQGNVTIIGDNEFPNTVGAIMLGGPAQQLAVGAYHACALMNDNGVRCWGYNAYGGLGYGNLDSIGDNEVPSMAGVVDVGGNVTQLTAGATHTCALLDNGKVRCWGGNDNGELGYGNTDYIGDDELPSAAGDVDIGGNATQICAGGYHSCALLDNGEVRCWGEGGSGRLGYGNMNDIGDNEAPSSAGSINLGVDATAIACGGAHTCAITSNLNVRCWGAAFFGQLGYGDMNQVGDDESPASAGDVPLGGPVAEISLGASHSCALLDNGELRCWGQGAFGQLGLANTDNIGDTEVPIMVGTINIGGSVKSVGAGGFHNCAILDDGAVRCWGNGNIGQLGYGNTNRIGDDEVPASAGDVPYLP